jgi:predicted Zn finger-like uncharacterized protein
MRIECPSCGAVYEVADSLVPAGRIVRCARCAREWMPVPAAPVAEPRPEPDPPPKPPEPERPEVATKPQAATRPSAMDRLAAHRPTPRPSARLRLAWAASALLLVLAVAAAYEWRGRVVAGWPPSARVYALFGLEPQAETTP